MSDKTVFNHFPTKEALVLDRLDGTITSLRVSLADPEVPPLDAVLRILDGELPALTAMLARPGGDTARCGPACPTCRWPG